VTMPRPLAVQLYTFRETSRPGPAGLGLDEATLAAIAETGFLGVETVDVPGGDPVAARRALDALGLQVASSHSWADPSDADAIERASAAIAELGSTRIIVSGGPFASVAEVDALADRLNAAAVAAGRNGLRLGYHNHSSEMRALDDIPLYRRLRDRLDPAVDFQVDIFWVVVGGADPATVIDDLGDRVVSLHIKDGLSLPSAADAEPFVNVAVGQGVIDVATAVAAADRHPGIEWLIVEFDYCDGPPIEAVRDSYAHLVTRGLGRGTRA
jgi:sugar phosphate isomerase/epimerase